MLRKSVARRIARGVGAAMLVVGMLAAPAGASEYWTPVCELLDSCEPIPPTAHCDSMVDISAIVNEGVWFFPDWYEVSGTGQATCGVEIEAFQVGVEIDGAGSTAWADACTFTSYCPTETQEPATAKRTDGPDCFVGEAEAAYQYAGAVNPETSGVTNNVETFCG